MDGQTNYRRCTSVGEDTSSLREAKGGGREETTTPPVVIRFLSNSGAANSRRWSSVKSITDRNRNWKTTTIIKLECSSITRQASYHLCFIILSPPLRTSFWVRHYSCRPAGELEREFKRMTGVIILSVLQAQPFFLFFFLPKDTFIIRSKLLAPLLNTWIGLKGQRNARGTTASFLPLLIASCWG